MPPSLRSTSSRRHLDTRNLHADEAYGLDAYEDHAKYCSRCAVPLGSAALYSRGNSLAADVIEYICQHEGQFYARRSHPGDVTDNDRLPPHAHSVRCLLEAVEHGFHLNTIREGDDGTPNPNPNAPSIHVIESRPSQSSTIYYVQIRPFRSRKKRFYIQIPLHSKLFGIGPSSSNLRVGLKWRSQRLEVYLRLYPEL